MPPVSKNTSHKTHHAKMIQRTYHANNVQNISCKGDPKHTSCESYAKDTNNVKQYSMVFMVLAF